MKIKFKTLVFLFICFVANLSAQEIKLDAVLDTGKARIGEQVKLDIYLSYDADQKALKIQWPTIGDTLTEKIEVVSVSPIDTTFPNKTNSTRIFQHQQIIVSVYDSGFYLIPPLKFVINGTDSLYTEPLSLEVHTVPTDTSFAAVKDIKPPLKEEFNWRWYLPHIVWTSIVLVAIIIAVIIFIRLRRRAKPIVAEPEKPKIPPHITALAELERIRTEQCWKEGQVKEYYSQISDAIRLYIEGRFGINAPESTTDEIMKSFRSQVIDIESKEKLQQMLTLSDLVKFAKMYPIETEHNFTLQHAFDFVNGTKREEVVEINEPTSTSEATT